MAKKTGPRKKRRALVVLGMHRAGTSALARVLALHGADLPRTLMAPGEDNPAGFWESRQISDLTEAVLRSAGVRWDALGAFPMDWFQSDAADAFQAEMTRTLKEEFGDSRLFVLKDPRLCRLTPLLAGALRDFGAEPFYILPVRNPLEVASSLYLRNQQIPARGMLLWLRHVLDAEYGTRGARRAFSTYQGLLEDWPRVMSRLSRTLSIRWPKSRRQVTPGVNAFLSETLRHHRASDEALENNPHIAETVSRVYQWCLSQAAGDSQSPAVLDEARRWLDEADRLYLPVLDASALSSFESSVDTAGPAERGGKLPVNSLSAGDAESARGEKTIAGQTRLAESELERFDLLRQLERAREQMARLEAEIEHSQSERMQHVRELETQLAEQVKTNKAHVIQLESELAEKTRHFNQELAQRDSALGHLHAELAEARLEVAVRDQQLTDIYHSRSWRALRPLRWVGKQARNVARWPTALASRVLKGRRWRLREAGPGYRLVRGFYTFLPMPAALRRRLRARALGWLDVGPAVHAAPTGADFISRIGPDGLLSKTLAPVSDTPPALDPQTIRFRGEAAPEISVVIPVYGECAMTLACLKSVAETHGQRSFEVIVVDDESPDDSGDILPRVPGLRYLRNHQNGGFIYSCNRGAAAARGRYILILNNDTLVAPDALDAMASTFDEHGDVGLVGAKLLFGDGSLQEAGGIVWSDGSAWNYGRDDDPRKPEYNYVRDVDYCSGAALMIPADLWRALDGFDAYYTRAYYEDTDLAFRVRAAGYRVLYQPMARVLHLEGRTSGTDETAGEKSHQVTNGRKFLARWQSVLADHRPNGELPELERDRCRQGRVLLIDAVTPMPDQDSGSMDLVNLIRMLHGMGLKTAFIPQSNLAYFAHYTDELQKMGTECLYHPYMASVRDHLESCGAFYDYVIIHRVNVFSETIDDVARYCPNAEIIFNTTDLHFLREQRQAELEDDDALMRQAAHTREIELAMMRRAHKTIVVSSFEQQMVRKEAPEIDVHHLPLIREVPGAAAGWEQRRNIAFIGGFRHPPNVDAMMHFATEIWPGIHREMPELTCMIVGSEMPDEVVKLNRIAGIHSVGFIEDLSSFLGGVRMTIAPLRYGAGAKGKVVSSLCHGVPMVVSSVAVEGMNCGHGRGVLVADSPAEWVTCVARLYNDPETWDTLSGAGVALMQREHSLAAGASVLQAIMTRSAGLGERIEQATHA